jgi:hypothetical protein
MANLEEPDLEWIQNQLREVGDIHNAKGNMTLGIINAINKRKFPGLAEDDLTLCMERALKLFLGHPIVETPLEDGRQWVEAVPGELSVRDRVRVKPDAYQGTVGTIHNGRVGRVVSMRNGSIRVVYDDADAEWSPGHDISLIEKLV